MKWQKSFAREELTEIEAVTRAKPECAAMLRPKHRRLRIRRARTYAHVSSTCSGTRRTRLGGKIVRTIGIARARLKDRHDEPRLQHTPLVQIERAAAAAA
jgi:hypothetical protein